jgi:hypothetical protein
MLGGHHYCTLYRRELSSHSHADNYRTVDHVEDVQKPSYIELVRLNCIVLSLASYEQVHFVFGNSRV